MNEAEGVAGPTGDWWPAARHCPSPHCDDRPPGVSISLVVVHNISLPPGEFGGPWIDDLFCGRLDCGAHPWFEALRGLRVSAHFLIRRDGELIQYVPLCRRAWHAGKSVFDGRENCNDFSVGIELEGCDDLPYTDAQYDRLAVLVAGLRHRFPEIGPERIAGHSDVAPGRKTDPGSAFDWLRLRRALTRIAPGDEAVTT